MRPRFRRLCSLVTLEFVTSTVTVKNTTAHVLCNINTFLIQVQHIDEAYSDKKAIQLHTEKEVQRHCFVMVFNCEHSPALPTQPPI